VKSIGFLIVAVTALGVALTYMGPAARADGGAAPVLGGTLPEGYRDWKLISVAHEAGKLNDLRAVLGNDNCDQSLSRGYAATPGRCNRGASCVEVHLIGRK
jgi:hypothetical protein